MYGVRTVTHQLPCASGTYATQEAGTRSLYVQYGGPGTYGSAQVPAAHVSVRRLCAGPQQRTHGRRVAVACRHVQHRVIGCGHTQALSKRSSGLYA